MADDFVGLGWVRCLHYFVLVKKVNMKSISKLYWSLSAVLMVGLVHNLAFAQGIKLTDVQGSSGAGTKDLSALATKAGATAQSFADLAIILFTFVGVLIFGISLFGLYKAGKEDRESPKGAIFGLLVGGALTSVVLLLGMSRNTFGITS
jgi:hypothetical protein